MNAHRKVFPLLVIVFLPGFSGCAGSAPEPERGAPREEIVIRYVIEPFATFEIAGTDARGLKLEDLVRELEKLHRERPRAVFALESEVKCVPEVEDEILAAIRGTGAELVRYDPPYSEERPEEEER